MKWDKETDGIFTMPKYIEKGTQELIKLADSRSEEWVENELAKRRLAAKKRHDKAVKMRPCSSPKRKKIMTFRMRKKPGSKWLVMPQLKKGNIWIDLAFSWVPVVDAKRIIAETKKELGQPRRNQKIRKMTMSQMDKRRVQPTLEIVEFYSHFHRRPLYYVVGDGIKLGDFGSYAYAREMKNEFLERRERFEFDDPMFWRHTLDNPQKRNPGASKKMKELFESYYQKQRYRASDSRYGMTDYMRKFNRKIKPDKIEEAFLRLRRQAKSKKIPLRQFDRRMIEELEDPQSHLDEEGFWVKHYGPDALEAAFKRLLSYKGISNPQKRRNPAFKVGDKVEEGGRTGKIVAMHTKGTADVLFKGMDYPIRRQIPSLRRINGGSQKKKLPRGYDYDDQGRIWKYVREYTGFWDEDPSTHPQGRLYREYWARISAHEEYEITERMKKLAKTPPSKILYLRKTKEKHSGGADVYRPVEEPAQRGKYGMLSGQYYIGDAGEMYVVGKPYKDHGGVFDGEPEYKLEIPYEIVGGILKRELPSKIGGGWKRKGNMWERYP